MDSFHIYWPVCNHHMPLNQWQRNDSLPSEPCFLPVLWVLTSCSLLFNFNYWCFQIVCWKRPLKVPQTARRPNQSILKRINPEYSLEGLMLKLQSFGPLMRRADSLEKTLRLGKMEGKRRRGPQRMRWLDSVADSMDMSMSKLQKMPEDREAWHAAVYGASGSDTT